MNNTEKNKRNFVKPVFFGICFAVFTLLADLFDVEPAGPQGSRVGFAGLNTAIHVLLGTNDFCYKLTQLFGILALLVAAAFAVTGLVQLIKRKSLFKVDINLLMLGLVYIILTIIYVIFEKFPLNYRPVILDEGLEPSYPSTHTMLILTILGTAVSITGDYIKNPKLLFCIKLACLIVMALTVVCRLLSGVHWFTDIAGGVLVSLFLISLYKTLRAVPDGEK